MMATAPPDFLIIGAMKAGTTWLYSVLAKRSTTCQNVLTSCEQNATNQQNNECATTAQGAQTLCNSEVTEEYESCIAVVAKTTMASAP